MAMAELFIHEVEESLPHFPPAPPPSPEAQRARSSFFEIPADAFGPLDLRRDQFLDLLSTQSSSLTKNSSPLSTVPERGSPSYNEEDEFGFPASPKKRVCNSPCSFPEGYEIESDEFNSGATGCVFSSSVLGSLKSVRPHRSPVRSKSRSPPLLAVSNSHSPPLIQNQSLQQTSPYSIPSRVENGFETNAFQPAHSYNPSLSPHSDMGMLSKSFDLHDVHPYQMTSDPIFPDVRPKRAHTLDTTNLEKEASQNRRRKISLKRTNQERGSDLQFSFEYSYTSTGSSEESDWLVVTPDVAANPSQEKKACQNHTPSLPLTFASPTYTNPTVGAALPPRQPPVSNIFTQPISSVYNQSPLTEQPPSLMSVDSVQMMDTGDISLRLDSLDSMECGGGEQLHSYTEMDTNAQVSPHTHTTHTSLFSSPTTIRSHSSEERYGTNRHSFVQNTKPSTEQGTSNISRSL